MKKLFTILLLFIGFIGFSQSDVQRSNGLNRLIDPRLAATKTFNPPIYADTTTANLAANIGKDSCGAIIVTRNPQAKWTRYCNPKRWVREIDVENISSYIDSNSTTLYAIDSNRFVICNGVVCDTFSTINNFTTLEFITDSSVKSCTIDSTVGGISYVCDTTIVGRQPIIYTANNWIRLTNPNQFVFGSNAPDNNDNFLSNTTYANTGYYRMIWDSRTIYDAGHEFRKMDGFGFPNGTSLVNFFHPDGFLGHINNVKLRVNYTADTVVASPFIDGYLGDAIGYSLGANWQGHGGYGNYLDNSRSKTALIHFHTFDTTNNKGVTIYAAPNGLAATNNFVLKNYSIADFNTDKSVTLQGYGSGSSFISTDTTNNKPAAYDANGKLVRLDRWPGSGGGSITDVVTTDNFLSVTGTTTKTVNTKKLFGNLVSGATITKDASIRQNDTLHLSDTANLVFTNLQSGDQGTIVVINDIANPELTVPDQIITLNSALGDTTILGWIYTGSYMIWATSASATGTGIAGIGTLDAQTKSANGGVFTLDSLYFQTYDLTHPGLTSTGNQTADGIKTFSRYLITDTISTSGSGNLTMLAPTGNFIIGTNAKFNFDQNNTLLRLGTSTVRSGYQLQIHGFFSSGAGSTDAISELTTSSNTTGTTALQFNINNGTGIGSIKGYGPSFASTLFGQSLAGAMSITGTSGGVFINGFNGPIHMGTFGTSTPAFTISTSNRVGIKNVTAPSAFLHLGVGLATASNAPLKFTTASAALLTTPEAGAMEVLVDSLYYTGNSGTRYKIYPQSTGLTSFTPYNGLTKVGTDSLKLGGTGTENTNIDWAAFTYTHTFNSITGNGLSITSTSTAAASNAQKLVNVSLSGANSTSAQTTYGIFSLNSHTGTNARNYAVYGEVQNGLGNSAGVVGIATTQIGVNGQATSGKGVQGDATNGTGVLGSVTSGIGIYGAATSGTGVLGTAGNTGLAGSFQNSYTSTNTVSTVLKIETLTTGTGANGIGGSIDFYHQTSSISRLANQLISKWSDATDATRTSQSIITGVNSGTTGDIIYFEGDKRTRFNGRAEFLKGADVASAGDLTLGADGNVFHITGTTTINAIITANWQAGSEIILIFDASVTVKNSTSGGAGTAVMHLSGAADFSATASDVLKLVYDGTAFYEVSRSVN